MVALCTERRLLYEALGELVQNSDTFVFTQRDTNLKKRQSWRQNGQKLSRKQQTLARFGYFWSTKSNVGKIFLKFEKNIKTETFVFLIKLKV